MTLPETGLLFLIIIIITLTSTVIALTVLYLKYKKLRNRFSGVLDIEKEIGKAEKKLTKQTKAAIEIEKKNQEKKNVFDQQYSTAKEIFEKLQKEVALLEENIEDISFGIYKPHYDFDTSEDYKNKLKEIRVQQKALIKNKRAAVCSTDWVVEGSKRKGARMQNQYLKLVLRAFNGESDASIAKVTWNNAIRMEERIHKAYEVLNKLGQVMQISLTPKYLELKISELRLKFEAEQKKQEEKEEQRQIKEQMREEEKARREAERARKEAEQEEKRHQSALEKARAEMEKSTGEQFDKLNEKIKLMEKQLEEAKKLKERAKSMAELTRSGHVYIISNIGSFGNDILKIGMTRRLEPMDRVKELGDASVPFGFDVHAMTYVEDAPKLEKDLHKHFKDRRVNLVNHRKEYFYITVNEIEDFLNSINLEIKLTKMAEAREYRETLAIRKKQETTDVEEKKKEEAFPDQVWET